MSNESDEVWIKKLEESLDSPNRSSFFQTVQQMVDAKLGRDTVRNLLEQLRLKNEGDDKRENIILDTMDCVWGHCIPSSDFYPELRGRIHLHKAIFLDRDGTLIAEKDYLHKPEQVVIFPGAVEALKKLQDAGFKLFLVTNQSGVGRGYFTMDDVEKVHAHLCADLGKAGVQFEKIYIAPEHPDEPSRGRKPSPQFLFDARDEFGIDLSQSYIIGDKLIDLECGWNAGVKKSLLVRTGYGAKVETEAHESLGRAIVVDDLSHAADYLLSALP